MTATVCGPCPNCFEEIEMEPSIAGDDFHPEYGGSVVSFKKGSVECPNCGEKVWPTLSIHADTDGMEIGFERWSKESDVKDVEEITIEYADGVTKRLTGEQATAWLGYVSEATDVYEEEHGEKPPDFEWTNFEA